MAKKLSSDWSVRRVVHDHPETRDLFRRHGEEDDRPVFGHLESLEHFARRRGLDLDQLLEEVAAATGLAVDRRARCDANLHRLFVAAALAVTLSLGAGWGAYLLTRIGLSGSFQAAPPGHVIAHGAAQLWGFVAVFIAGIAQRYLVLATGKSAPPAGLRLFVLAALLAGVLTGFAWSLAPRAAPQLAAISGWALLAGTAVHLVLVARLVWGKLAQAWARFVVVAAAWSLVWSCWTLIVQSRAGAAGISALTIVDRQIAMDLPLFGLALGSVYGFGRRLLPGFLATGTLREGAFEGAFWLHNGGLVALLIGRLLHQAPAIAAGLCGIAWGAAVYVAALRGVWGRPAVDRLIPGEPFLRRYVQLGFAWLLAASFAAAAIALVEAFRTGQVPHAIHGAVRHALTVGFLMTFLLGVAQRLLPILGHTSLAWPRLVVPIFVLLAAGSFLRVASQIATLAWDPAYAFLPLSAALEWAAVALFAANALRTLWPPPDRLLRSGQVTGRSRLATLLDEHPWLEDALIAEGVDYVRRVRQVPTELTLASFAVRNGLDPETAIARINARLRDHREQTTSGG